MEACSGAHHWVRQFRQCGHAVKQQDHFSRCARNLQERRGYWRAVVAIAAKNARLARAVSSRKSFVQN